MNLPALIYVTRWLIRDTFRQALASGILWLMLAVSGVCILVCLSVGVSGGTRLRQPGETPEFVREPTRAPDETEAHYHRRLEAFRAEAKRSGVDIPSGELSVGFGAIRTKVGRDAEDAVHYLELLLAGAVADTTGLLLALIWTAGFLPAFLEPSAASVLLAKPVPRWTLLLGKYLGVLVFLTFQAAVFVLGTWLALGLRTGVWDAVYLLTIPLLLLHFAIFYSFSVFLAVCTRSTIACVLGSLLFWLVCWGMNFGRHAVVALADPETIPASATWPVEIGYWVLPKPADMGFLLRNALHAESAFSMADFQAVQSQGAFHPELSILTSLLFAAVILAVAVRQFVTTDY